MKTVYNRADHLSHYDKQTTKFDNIHIVIGEARKAYCWIFNRRTLQWWTPDEFWDEFHNKDFSNFELTGFLEEISIRDPRSGISAGMKQLDNLYEEYLHKTKELRDKIEAFNKKVITYYQEAAKPRLGK